MKSEVSGRDVSEALPATPDDSDAGFTIAFALKKAAQLSNPAGRLVDGGAKRVREGLFMQKGVKGIKFMVGENGGSRCRGVSTRQKSDPEQPPSNDRKQGNHGHEALVGSQLRLFNATTGFEDFMQNFNLPAATIPADALDGVIKGANRASGQQQPAEWVHIACGIDLLNQDGIKRNRPHAGTQVVRCVETQ